MRAELVTAPDASRQTLNVTWRCDWPSRPIMIFTSSGGWIWVSPEMRSFSTITIGGCSGAGGAQSGSFAREDRCTASASPATASDTPQLGALEAAAPIVGAP